MSDVYDRVVNILITRFEVEPEEVRPDATFEELELDSLFLVELALVIQQDMGVKFSDPDEELLLPASIETLQVYSAAYGRSVEMRSSRLRRTQTFRHYRRFVTGSRILQ